MPVFRNARAGGGGGGGEAKSISSSTPSSLHVRAAAAVLLLLSLGGTCTATPRALAQDASTTPACTPPTTASSPPTCSTRYYKISDEANGLATSCAAVDQTSDPVLGLDQSGCQSSCDALSGCDTINYRWSDPNFGGESTCYRKRCASFAVAACTLFSKHKERDVYTKACGARELYGEHVLVDPFTNLWSGIMCPDVTDIGVSDLLGRCADGSLREPYYESCSQTYYKLSDEFNGQSSTCPPASVPNSDGNGNADPGNADVIFNLDQSACQASCDALPTCDTIQFQWSDPTYESRSSCHLLTCGTFDGASCSLDDSAGLGKDVYTKACGVEENWSDQVLVDANGLFAGAECALEADAEEEEEKEAASSTTAVTVADGNEINILETIECNPTDEDEEGQEQVCVDRYYKISDEANGLATSCAAVDQTADPVVGVDQAGCQASCDALEGCDTINYRTTDPNFGGESTCYRKRCENFAVATCTLFSKHKSRDVYTKACGAASLFKGHVIEDSNGLFAGVQCPDETQDEVADLLATCAATGGEGSGPDAVPAEQSCTTATYYKISDEFNGLATSCAAVDQTADPVVGLDQAGCQASCDALEGCNTINHRHVDPNFDGESTCYRKRCDSFQVAACTLFSKHKSRDVYTKACGAAELFKDHVIQDSNGLFAGVRCPGSAGPEASDAGGEDSGPRVCSNLISTNRTNSYCDVCSEWSGGDGLQSASASVRTCLVWEKSSSTGLSSCAEYAPSALQLQQRAEYNKFLQNRWTEVGLCNGEYVRGTTCEITLDSGEVCEVRDQPCHGGTKLGGVAGVLSAGWQMTFGTSEDLHVCTMCGRGTYGSCGDACAYRRNFFWSGYNLGSIEVDVGADEINQLVDAFVLAQPDETYEVPQTLELIPDVLAGLPEDHPLSASNLPSQAIYSIISVDAVLVTVRDQLELVAVGLQNAAMTEPDKEHLVHTILSTSGVKVYETCKCLKCPRGQFQDGLGETRCKSCEEILPGSDTPDTGADGPQLCECLAANDNFLSADGTRCVPLDLVRQGLAAAPRAPSSASASASASASTGICPYDTYEIDASEAPDDNVSDAPEGWMTCTPCPAGTSTFNAERTEHDYGASIDNCYCTEGTYATSDGCASCPTLQTSAWNSQSSSDCHLTDSALMMAIVIPLGLVLFGALLGLTVRRFRKKIAALEAEKRRQMQEKVNEATETVNHLAHPMVFVSVADFLAAGRMVKHEEARTQHVLITVDTTEELKGFKKTNKLIFFSHQWLAWSEPDPEGVQYKAMTSGLEDLTTLKKLDLANTYVWLDYTSIPQTHRGLQRLSINSLTNYAGACDYFVVVAPGETMHADTGTLCDKKSYQERTWCRAEQLAHGCRLGVENMYLTNAGGSLEPVTWDWIKPSFKIFSGKLTCCARGHEGMEQCDKEYLVTPVLGLYCELLALDKCSCLPREKKEVLDFMQQHEEEVFPQSFHFSKPGKARGEQRELFGDILTLLEELDLKCDIFQPNSSASKPKKQLHQSIMPERKGSAGTSPPSDSSGGNASVEQANGAGISSAPQEDTASAEIENVVPQSNNEEDMLTTSAEIEEVV